MDGCLTVDGADDSLILAGDFQSPTGHMLCVNILFRVGRICGKTYITLTLQPGDKQSDAQACALHLAKTAVDRTHETLRRHDLESPTCVSPSVAGMRAEFEAMNRASAVKKSQSRFDPGTGVMVQGLEQKMEFNGKFGIIQKWDEENGYYQATLFNDDVSKPPLKALLRPWNLVALDDEEPELLDLLEEGQKEDNVLFPQDVMVSIVARAGARASRMAVAVSRSFQEAVMVAQALGMLTELGDIVQIHSLVSSIGAQNNDKTGVVLRKEKNKDPSIVRYLIYRPGDGYRPSKCLSVKPSNLRQIDFNETKKVHQSVAFWPQVSKNAKIPLTPLNGFPEDDGSHSNDGSIETQERSYLKNTLGWKNTEILCGVEHPNRPNPCWAFYYDADDTESPVNEAAMSIARLLPGYECSKVEGPKDGKYRGLCVLLRDAMESPMESTFTFGSSFPASIPTSTTSTTERERWSLNEMRGVLDWHRSSSAAAQYREHDDPMHRMSGMFGDLSPMFGAGPGFFPEGY